MNKSRFGSVKTGHFVYEHHAGRSLFHLLLQQTAQSKKRIQPCSRFPTFVAILLKCVSEGYHLFRFLSFYNACHVKGEPVLKILTYKVCLTHASASINGNEL